MTPQQHCELEVLCKIYHPPYNDYEISCNLGSDKYCSHDTRSRPAPSPQFNSTELLLLAHDEWKRRQERKHLDDEAAWVSGFINGFLTDKKWAREYLDKMRGEP